MARYGRAQRAQKTYYDQRQREIRFKKGDSAWLAIKRMKKRGPYKLNPQRWEGPYEIRKFLSTTVFVIACSGRQQTQLVSEVRLTLVINCREDLIPSSEILTNNTVSTEPSDISEVITGEFTGTNYNLDTQQEMRLVTNTPEQLSIPSHVQVGFITEASELLMVSRPTRQRRSPQRYGNPRRLSDYEDPE